jgi:OPA family sugar phosphate sensor protein UhpC-like MFS transporter
MVRPLLAFYRPAPRALLIEEPGLQARALRRWRWRVFLSITLGYGFFYTTRLGLSVAKRPLLDARVVDAAQLGRIGAALLIAYAVGKAVNGFWGIASTSAASSPRGCCSRRWPTCSSGSRTATCSSSRSGV